MAASNEELRTRLYALKGMASELPKSEQEKIEELVRKIKEVIKEHQEHIQVLATSIVATECVLEENNGHK